MTLFRKNSAVLDHQPDRPAMHVLVVLGHPRADSLCGALADAFCKGAAAAQVELRRLDLAELDYDVDVHTPSPNDQPLEPDLSRARELVDWADHLVFIYPTWWGTAPALLKGFLDRILEPGFAFRTTEGGIGYEGLLKGRSAQLITTMDTPPLIHRLLYREPGKNAMARASLGFCGVKPIRTMTFGSVKDAVPDERRVWVARAEQLGRDLKRGRITPAERIKHKVGTWLKALRLQFYLMTWVAYAVGGVAVAAGTGIPVFSSPVFWLGYLCLFLVEVATVLINEVVDYPSDRQNQFYSTFTGGSRVLVEGLLSRQEVYVGIALAVVGGLGCAVGLLWLSPAAPGALLGLLAVMSVLAIGYTAPPLKLSYRTLGELDVAVTHSLGVLLSGYLFLGGRISDPLPWLLSLPLLLAILPSIILSGVPDRAADDAAGKRTLAVRFGTTGALWLALTTTLASAGIAVTWQYTGWAGGAFAGIGFVVVPHATLLVGLLARKLHSNPTPGRLDGLMAASLSYVLWFGLFPLFNLAS